MILFSFEMGHEEKGKTNPAVWFNTSVLQHWTIKCIGQQSQCRKLGGGITNFRKDDGTLMFNDKSALSKL